jgi:hypothetical protein
MLDLFLNPGYIAAAGALVSAPIIIHLINRMRFKRLRWAAMEFLLKSQKRNRRRLIIEQLLLLALRCLLVLLTGLLVARFVGFSLAGFIGQDSLHIVVVDDTLSMSDQWKEGSEVKTAFKVAKDDVIFGGIVKALGQSTTNERLAIIPLSKLVTEDNYEPRVFQKLNDAANEKAVKNFLDELPQSNLHVDLLRGVEKAKQIFGNNPGTRPILHLVSDFRQVDWGGADAEGLRKALRQLHENKVQIRPTDVAHPYRIKGQGGVPLSSSNLAILDLRANTRVVGKGMPVTFTVTVANYGPNPEKVNVVIYDDSTGKELPQVDFNPGMPLKLGPDSTASATFELRLFPEIKATEKFHAQRLSAHLETPDRTPLDQDGLAADNVRYAAVEIRNKVPVLVIDGEGPRGRAENKDSFFIEKAIISVPGGSYEVVYGDELSGGVATRALERADLRQYPTIFLLNVRQLEPKQLRNLQNYVAEGGGLAVFLGPNVSPAYYNKELYKGGQGLFPVPLRANFNPPPNEEPRKTAFTKDYQLRVRPDLFGDHLEDVPIFGKVFPDVAQMGFLKDLPIGRYFPVPRSEWTVEPGRVFELATLPNDQPATAYQAAAVALVDKLPVEDKEYRQCRPGLKRYAEAIRGLVAPGSEQKAYKLGELLSSFLTDQGKKDAQGKKEQADYPNLTEFWQSPDPKISKSLKKEAEDLRDESLYGDPFVVAQRYGKGRVTAVMSTAGKEWNDWGGGSEASIVYQPFIWEMQNWLSSQTGEENLTIGTPTKLEVDSGRFKQEGKNKLMMVRTFYKAQPNQPAEKVEEAPSFGAEGKDVQTFTYTRTFEPGFYLYQLFSQDDTDKRNPLAAWGFPYNVDAVREGKLRRVSQEDFEKGLGIPGMPAIQPPPQGQMEDIVNRRSDLSEWAWFFLLFLAVLVAEQALAVHLSFHLRAAEGELPVQVVRPQTRAA